MVIYIRAFMVAHPSSPLYIQQAAPAARISSNRHAGNREENQCSTKDPADLHKTSLLLNNRLHRICEVNTYFCGKKQLLPINKEEDQRRTENLSYKLQIFLRRACAGQFVTDTVQDRIS